MARKIIGMARKIDPIRNLARRWRILISFVVVVGAGVAFVQTVLAVHDAGMIQLDGNALQSDTTVSGSDPVAFSNGVDDWDNVCHEVDPLACPGVGPTIGDGGATAVSWSPDNLLDGTYSTSATIFSGGGSKDPELISSWAWKDGSGGLPDKDNLVHAFAARYSVAPNATTCPAGTAPTCELLFFGSDRFDNSGDAHQAFWFLQSKVGLGTNKVGGGFGFTGAHTPGDLLIISAFSNGGAVSTISIFKWDPTVPGNLLLLEESTTANCADVGGTDQYCGIVNVTSGAVAPWSFVDKTTVSASHPANTYLDGEFLEAGVNLSTLGLADKCFSTLVAETRSSTSTTATLKDFILAPLGDCAATLTTTPSVGAGGLVSPGTSVFDTATVLGVGGAPSPTPTGDVEFFWCTPSQLTPANTGLCSSGGTSLGVDDLESSDPPVVGQAEAISASIAPTAPGRYCFRAEWPGDDNYPTPLTHAGTGNSECFTVQDTSAATSAQDWLPNDSATVTSTNGASLSGELTIQLYTGDNCGATTGAPVSGQLYTTGAFTNVGASKTLLTNNTTFLVTATGETKISWKVVFTSSDPTVISTSHCEKTTLTITN